MVSGLGGYRLKPPGRAQRYYRFEEFPETSPVGPRVTPDAGSVCVPGFIRADATVTELSPLGSGVFRDSATAVYAPSVGLPDGGSERTVEFWVNPISTVFNNYFNLSLIHISEPTRPY